MCKTEQTLAKAAPMLCAMSKLKPPARPSDVDERETRISAILRRVQRELHDSNELIADVGTVKTVVAP